MQIRIKLSKIMLFHANPDPQPCGKVAKTTAHQKLIFKVQKPVSHKE
jgi:hypothetical protein